jgi:gliding motility-associated-like protein
MVSNTYPNGSYVIAQGINADGCISNFDSSLVIITTEPQFDINSNGGNCFGNLVTLSSNITANSMIWTGPFGTMTGNQITFPLNYPTGTYSLTITDSLGCSWTDSLSISTLPAPFTFQSDTIICFTDWLQTMSQFPDLLITNANGNPIDTLALYDNSWNTMTLTSISTGCSITQTVYIEIVSCSNIIPNIITANGDGVNDYLIIPKAMIQPNNNLTILNRWNQVVYEMDGYQNTWDGGDLNVGVYFYVYNPDRLNSNSVISQGFIQIIR